MPGSENSHALTFRPRGIDYGTINTTRLDCLFLPKPEVTTLNEDVAHDQFCSFTHAGAEVAELTFYSTGVVVHLARKRHLKLFWCLQLILMNVQLPIAFSASLDLILRVV